MFMNVLWSSSVPRVLTYQPEALPPAGAPTICMMSMTVFNSLGSLCSKTMTVIPSASLWSLLLSLFKFFCAFMFVLFELFSDALWISLSLFEFLFSSFALSDSRDSGFLSMIIIAFLSVLCVALALALFLVLKKQQIKKEGEEGQNKNETWEGKSDSVKVTKLFSATLSEIEMPLTDSVLSPSLYISIPESLPESPRLAFHRELDFCVKDTLDSVKDMKDCLARMEEEKALEGVNTRTAFGFYVVALTARLQNAQALLNETIKKLEEEEKEKQTAAPSSQSAVTSSHCSPSSPPASPLIGRLPVDFPASARRGKRRSSQETVMSLSDLRCFS